MKERCWSVVGYPPGHPKHQKDGKFKQKEFESSSRGGRWNRGGRNGRGGRIGGNSSYKGETAANMSSGSGITPKQPEQLMKLMPAPSKVTPDTEDEMDYSALCRDGNMQLCWSNKGRMDSGLWCLKSHDRQL